MIRPHRRQRAERVILWGAVAAIAAALLLLSCAGCAGSRSDYRGRLAFSVDPSGAVRFDRDTRAAGQTTAPANAAGPTTQSAGEAGAWAQVAGTFAPFVDRLASSRPELFTWAAIGLGLASVFALARGMIPTGLILGAAAGAFAITPAILTSWLPVAAGALLILGAVAWAVYRFAYARRRRQALPGVAKLAKESRAAEALAAMRAADPDLDAAFSATPREPRRP